jgi:SAM-dependent methyltransferase
VGAAKITALSGREHSDEEPLHVRAGAVVLDPPHALLPSETSVSTTAAAPDSPLSRQSTRIGEEEPARCPHSCGGHNVRVPSFDAASGRENEPHHRRRTAESFGSDPERYDRARPRYPDALIERITAAAPGGLVLDVGVGTGIVARQLQAAGCHVLGVDPDARLAGFARDNGVEVEVSTFEAWEAAGREFDAVVSGESWHWVDPVAGAAKAADVLRPGGRLAVFWITGQPPMGLEEAFAEVYRRVLPESLVARLGRRSIEEAHSAMCANAADGIRASGAFDEPERWRFEWVKSYTRGEWLDALQTSGGAIPESQLAGLLEGVGDAIDAVGGSFTMRYVTFVVTAVRRS